MFIKVLIILFVLPSLFLLASDSLPKQKKGVVNITNGKATIVERKKQPNPKTGKILKVDILSKIKKESTKKEKKANIHSLKNVATPEVLPTPYKSISELMIDIFSDLDFKDSKFSFTILDEKGKIKASVNKDLKLNQASVSKLIVSLAAIKYLGLNYRFKTNFYIDSEIDKDGILDGNLIIKGFGDPNLLVEDIYKIIDFFKIIGLKEIKGNIILDLSYFDKKYSIAALKDEDNSRAYAAFNNALPLNYNSVKFSIKPYIEEEELEGIAPKLSNQSKNKNKNKNKKDEIKVYISYPSSLVIKLKNKLKISKRWSRIKAETSPKKWGYTQLELKGRINEKTELLVLYRRVSNPDYYFGKIFHRLLKYSRIKVKGRLKLRYTNQVFRKTKDGFKYKKGVKFLYSHQTKYLLDTIIIMNRYSNNFIAEQLLKIIGAKTSKTDTEFGVGSWENGIKAVNKILTEDIKLDKTKYQYMNASGLNDSNFFTSYQISKIMYHVKNNFDYKWYLLSSLPKIGISGTMKRYCLSEDCKGAVLAKTGSLRSTVALAGFINASGKTYSFSLAVNFARSRKKFKKILIKARELMTHITELDNL